ncbi:CopG family ribbon-helix-helix protein [Crocosphaera sp. Alani8]|uniref:CopG family ribbon-helix-helix protein n=1 Tax=Crocosphaera sp. Alani8 TaxID=3038952 RepID=UPI00313DB99B
MTDNDIKTPTDKPITVRIPLDLLGAIENLASDRYPSRKGTGGNRSQVILDALEFYQSHQWGEGDNNLQSVQSISSQEIIEETVKKFISDNVHDIIQKTVHEKLRSTQNNLDQNSLQSVQSISNKDDVTLQSTQGNTENKPSENSLESGLKDNQVLEPIATGEPPTDQISEDIPPTETNKIPKSPTRQKTEENEGKLNSSQLADILGINSGTVTRWAKKRYEDKNLKPPQKNKEKWDVFMQWDKQGNHWIKK